MGNSLEILAARSGAAILGGPATAQAIPAIMDADARIVTDPNEFDALLLKAAPLAHLKLREIELTSLSGSARRRSPLLQANGHSAPLSGLPGD